MLERFLRMSGITDKQISRQNTRMEMANEEFNEIISVMIDDIFIHELRDVVEIRQLLPEDQWDRYEMMEIEELREQLLLKEALKRLRNKYREILSYGREKKSGKTNNSENS